MQQIHTQNYDQSMRISSFLSVASPIVTEIVQSVLRSCGCQIQQKGSGLDITFSIKSRDIDTDIEFYLRNLLLEIVSMDRDQTPLRFDENLKDFDYFLAKTVRLVQSKLKILLHLLEEKDTDKAIEEINLDAKQYERIRIWKLDQNKQAKNEGPS